MIPIAIGTIGIQSYRVIRENPFFLRNLRAELGLLV